MIQLFEALQRATSTKIWALIKQDSGSIWDKKLFLRGELSETKQDNLFIEFVRLYQTIVWFDYCW